mgnify:CR=1 FL=1
MINFKNKFTKKLLDVIPGGAHTYSRGADQYPDNAPSILHKGKGVYIYDDRNRKLLDYGMGLRSVNIGYSEKTINNAAIKEINNGNNLTRPSLVELKAAQLLTKSIDSVDMVKFTKNGSTAVTAAVKLARAFTKKKIILRCKQQPFFSYDDWFIASTIVNRGIPKEIINLTKTFNYNDTENLKKIIKKYKNQIACVVLEPSSTECPKINKDDTPCCMKYPCNRNFRKKNHFLKEVENICRENNIVFILDEMITGFRWHLKGAQYFYGVKPDISTFGKAMANGFSVAAVSGKRKIMELGSITNAKEERVFLLSTTHGAEMSGLGGFIATLNFLKKKNVIQHIWRYGSSLIKEINSISNDMGLINNFSLHGIACSPYYLCRDNNGKVNSKLRTVFMREMIRNGILMPWIAIAYRHDQKCFHKTLNAITKTLKVYKKYVKNRLKFKGRKIKPVFRKFN